jgi:hypothetical protein
VHRSSDRVKDASPEREHGFSCLRRVHVRWLRVLDGVPLLGDRRTSDVIGAPLPWRNHDGRTGRPRSAFRQSPAKSSAFPKTGMPFTASNAKVLALREGIAPSGLRAGPLSHAAHTCFSVWKEVLLMGIARSRCGHPRVRDGNLEVPRVQTPLLPADPDRAWD